MTVLNCRLRRGKPHDAVQVCGSKGLGGGILAAGQEKCIRKGKDSILTVPQAECSTDRQVCGLGGLEGGDLAAGQENLIREGKSSLPDPRSRSREHRWRSQSTSVRHR